MDLVQLHPMAADTLTTPTLDQLGSRRDRAATNAKTTPTVVPIGPALCETSLGASRLNSAPRGGDSGRRTDPLETPVASEVKGHGSKRKLNGAVSRVPNIQGSEEEISVGVPPSPAPVVPRVPCASVQLHVPEPPIWIPSLLDFESQFTQEDVPPTHMTTPLQDVAMLTNELALPLQQDDTPPVDVPSLLRGRKSADVASRSGESEPREPRPQETNVSHQSIMPHPHQPSSEEPRPHLYATEEPRPHLSATEEPRPHQSATEEELQSYQSVSREPHPPTEEPRPPTEVGGGNASIVNGISGKGKS